MTAARKHPNFFLHALGALVLAAALALAWTSPVQAAGRAALAPKALRGGDPGKGHAGDQGNQNGNNNNNNNQGNDNGGKGKGKDKGKGKGKDKGDGGSTGGGNTGGGNSGGGNSGGGSGGGDNGIAPSPNNPAPNNPAPNNPSPPPPPPSPNNPAPPPPPPSPPLPGDGTPDPSAPPPSPDPAPSPDPGAPNPSLPNPTPPDPGSPDPSSPGTPDSPDLGRNSPDPSPSNTDIAPSSPPPVVGATNGNGSSGPSDLPPSSPPNNSNAPSAPSAPSVPTVAAIPSFRQAQPGSTGSVSPQNARAYGNSLQTSFSRLFFHFKRLLHLWGGNHAGLSLRQDGVAGTVAILVSLVGHAPAFAIYTPHGATTHKAGAKYRLSTWLRSAHPGATLCLRTQELSRHNQLIRTTETCISARARWQHFRLSTKALGAKHKLRFSVYQLDAVPGDSFEVGGLTAGRVN